MWGASTRKQNMAEVIAQIPSLKLGLVINCMKSLKMPKGGNQNP